MSCVPDLTGHRILVVEDEYFLALDIADQIEEHGGVVLGPVATLAAGITAFYELMPDACIVNINLGPDKVYELADMMMEAGVPFVFASSELRERIPERFADVPLHAKPFRMVDVAAVLVKASVSEAGE